MKEIDHTRAAIKPAILEVLKEDKGMLFIVATIPNVPLIGIREKAKLLKKAYEQFFWVLKEHFLCRLLKLELAQGEVKGTAHLKLNTLVFVEPSYFKYKFIEDTLLQTLWEISYSNFDFKQEKISLDIKAIKKLKTDRNLTTIISKLVDNPIKLKVYRTKTKDLEKEEFVRVCTTNIKSLKTISANGKIKDKMAEVKKRKKTNYKTYQKRKLKRKVLATF